MPSLFSVIRCLSAFSVLLMVFCVLEAELAATTRAVLEAETRAVSNFGSSSSIAKEGCKDSCGGVSIPYPFGMGTSNCYRDDRFKITCKYYSPFLEVNGTHQVLEISLALGHVRVRIVAPVFCEIDTSRDVYRNLSTFSLELTPFTVSNTLNQFVVLGCNIRGYIIPNNGYISDSDCYASCDYVGMQSECVDCGHCSNTTVPTGLKQYDILTYNFGEDGLSTIDLCIHAFIADRNFSGIGDLKLSRDDYLVPVFWDWAITDYAVCKEAQRDRSSYACGLNSFCLESQNDSGYRCKCSDGYEGNPYLLHGCQDVDECKEFQKCGKGVNCINTLGSHKCSCSPGKKLRSTEHGFHCTPGLFIVAVSSGIGVSILALLLLGIGYWLRKGLVKRKQLKRKHFERNGGLLLEQKITSNDGKVERAAKIFVTEELEKMTDNFNPCRIIGKGGFGTVFKGMLTDGEIVAVKKSTLVDENQVDQFINEVAILSQINHRHIVKLLGCCLETQVPLLVYEFVPNGTLSHHLHVEEGDNESILSWKDRVRIASEIAGALAYLHSDASMPIFHRDIKSTNILLDADCRSKVSDFGISRSIAVDKTHLTTHVQGTFGYLDPEYYRSCRFTDKSDVYSFGIVLVELLTGQKAISQVRQEDEMGIVVYFINSVKENRFPAILDSRVSSEGDREDVLVVAKLAKRCLKSTGKKRPTMKEVSLTLSGLHEKLSGHLLHW